jgi:DNA invertase Pin-like site-specific DNA recombinase
MSENNSTLTPAAAYYRMSDDRQENSIDRQKSQVRPHAQKHGYFIVREYIDEGIAGDEITKRKEFQRLLRDAQAGVFRAILCDDKDRFGRFDSIDSGEIIAPLRRKGVWIDSVAQGKIDWNSFAGRVTDAVLQEAKNMESDALSRRVLSMQLLAARDGKYSGGPPTYGYRLEPDPLRGKVHVPDGHKAEVVRFIFRRYDEGASLGQIARELFERGVRSPRGGARWARNVLWELLQKRKYVGDGVWGVKPMGKRHRHGGNGKLSEKQRGAKRVERLPPGEWIIKPDDHEPIIDRDLFERVQARLHGNQDRKTPHTGGGAFVLTRLLVCGHCGSYLLGATSRKGKRFYSCGGYIRYGKGHCNLHTMQEAPLLRLLIRKLQDVFLDQDNLQELRDAARAKQLADQSENNLERLQKRAEQLESKIERGGERLLEVPKEVFAEAAAALVRLKKERADVLAEIQRAQTEKPMDDLEQRIADAEAAVWRLQDALRAEEWPLLRQVLRETFARMELFWTHKKHAKITRSRLERGVIHMQAHKEVWNLLGERDR